MGTAYVGTSGFAYKEWRPAFYPEKLPEGQFLQHYATRLPAVEIDYTFYRMPNAKTIEGWIGATPDGFKFALKASQKITHFERLRVPSSALDYLNRTVPQLGSRLGCLLYQLPGSFKCDTGRLEAFLAELPSGIAPAFEFRHESWFSDPVYRLLEKHKAALAVCDDDDGTTPIELTGPFTYVRLRRTIYEDADLDVWRRRIAEWCQMGVDAYAFLKHEDDPRAPLQAEGLARQITGTELAA